MKTHFLNARAVRLFALQWAEANRHHKFSRVSPEFLARIDGAVRAAVIAAVKSQPSKGQTLR